MIMKRILIAGGAFVAVAILFVVVTLAIGRRVVERVVGPGEVAAPAAPATSVHRDHLYGRITTVDGETYEGRLQWGGEEEAFWSDDFGGWKDENPWAGSVSPDLLMERNPVALFGIVVMQRQRPIDLRRPFLARFGDIARIDAGLQDIRVTLKSGAVHELDRLAADDLADGVRVWDEQHGVIDLNERGIRSIEFMASAGSVSHPDPVPDRLHGTVRTRHGRFTGFIQWDWEKRLGSDVLEGLSEDVEVNLPFDTIAVIARHKDGGALVTLRDGRELVLTGTRDVGDGNRGIYVDDPRYGRVLIPWEAFVQVDFAPGGDSPGYGDFPPGRPLTGSVETRDGRWLVGRLVFDLDESETTETLDAPSQGVHYMIPFGAIASIMPSFDEDGGSLKAWVLLHDGQDQVLVLDHGGDLGEGNAGMLVFVDGHERPEYVRWADVEQIRLDRPPAMVRPIDER